MLWAFYEFLPGCSRRANAAIITLITLFIFAGCKQNTSSTSAPATTATPPSGPRIVSTVPAATAQLLQIGAADQLAGVSKYDLPILPDNKRYLPVVGDYNTLNYEQLVQVHPTALVLQITPSQIDARLKEIIARQHIELLNIHLDTIADLYTTAAALGRISGHANEAAAAIAGTRQALADIKRQWADVPHRRVAYLVGTSPIEIAGNGTFVDEMLAIAGGQNVGSQVGANYPVINREVLINLAPDVLLIAAPGEPPSQGLADRRLAAWIDLPIPAARLGRLYLVTDPNCQLATLKIADLVRTLARLIHQGDEPALPGKAAP